MKELDLGKERIPKLIKKFAIPCVISMIVAALYNIVDQIFIGWSEAGAYWNAVFSYGTGIINISDATINTSSNNSGGVMVTGEEL